MDSNLSWTSPFSSAKLKFAFNFRTKSSAVLLLSSTVGCTVTGKPLFYILTYFFKFLPNTKNRKRNPNKRSS